MRLSNLRIPSAVVELPIMSSVAVLFSEPTTNQSNYAQGEKNKSYRTRSKIVASKMLKNQEQSKQLRGKELEVIAPNYDILQSVRKVMAISGSIGLMMLTAVGAVTLHPNSASAVSFETGKCDVLCNFSPTAHSPTMRTPNAPDQRSHNYVVTIVNHSNTPIDYDFKEVSGRDKKGNVPPRGRTSVDLGKFGSPMEYGNFPVIKIPGAPTSPGFRFWSGDNGFKYRAQYINLLGGDGWKVTKDTKEFNELEGNGFRVTVGGGGHRQTVSNIHIQVYNK